MSEQTRGENNTGAAVRVSASDGLADFIDRQPWVCRFALIANLLVIRT